MAENDALIYAPMLIGVFLNCILYGATLVQALMYFQTFKSDKWWMKIFTLNTAFDVGVVYEPLIIRYATPRVATVAPTMSVLKCCLTEFIDWSSEDPLMTVLISLPVQLFIAWRVKVMSRSIILPAIISFFAFASFVGGFTTMVSVILIHMEYARFPQNYGAVITWLASSAVADVIITASLVHSLWRKRTGFAATDDVINRIIRLTVQTGLITAVSATIDVTLFIFLKIEVVTTVTTDFHPRQLSGSVPMKVLDSGGDYGHDDTSSGFNVVEAV
ncbi:hypothetical protein OG21DRAFT_1489889 [Imleria badia]|nr:hypothetical protein OG21DRAFT_1489889 [Imleria badia]